MKRIIKFTGLLTLILFSFFYTDKVVEVIRENDKLMIELEQVSDNYKVNAINGIISGDTIKPGINGKKVNIEKSYKQMKEKGIFDENLIKYDKIVPKINMSHNQNKYIIGGNKERNMVSIVFILDNKKYLKKVEDLSKQNHLIILCGHYEGIDQRVLDKIVDEEVSIGEYVLTVGEIPAMVLIDSVSRYVEGVLNKESIKEESFSNGLLEYPQYTRPEVFEGEKVPDILLSGNHQNIDKWRKQKSLEITKSKRPDLLLK